MDPETDLHLTLGLLFICWGGGFFAGFVPVYFWRAFRRLVDSAGPSVD